jgi:hypothetical protein
MESAIQWKTLYHPASYAGCKKLLMICILPKLESVPVVPFWIDTLMVPIEAEAKAKAIAGMEPVYRSADKVLVFNASLERIESDRDPQELMMRVYLSPWMSRLWILQEAFRAKELWFKFADNSIRFEDLPRRFDKTF